MRNRIRVLLTSALAFLSACDQAPNPTSSTMPEAAPAPAAAQRDRFKLYKTQNMFTFLQLDSRTGHIWQLQYSTDDKVPRGTVPLLQDALADGPDGRFALTATDNMWNFILLDTIDGRTWQCQYSLKDENRGCVPIDGPHDSN